VNFYLRRIRQMNPALKAVIAVNPRALEEARAADAARRRGDRRPLLGIPIVVKDNINTTGMSTTAGSWALAGSTPSDAFIVKRLKDAGAIILGKANLSEWANFRSAPSSSGWSGIGGQGAMPYVLDRNPCGSSSGSAVVAAASLAVAAIGTETDGSIVCPSGANGIVGIKPTLGLWSREGIVPISADQDTAGPMARNVTDAAVLLGAATGVDPHDPATAGQRGKAFRDYTQFLDDEALEGTKIGVWWDGTTFNEDVADVLRPFLETHVIDPLHSAGATVVEGADIDLSDAFGPELDALLCEFKTDVEAYLERYARGTNPVTGQPYPQTLRELIEFNETYPDLEGPWNSLLFELADSTNGRDAVCAGHRASTTLPARQAIDELLETLELDAIVALTNGPAWPTDPVDGDLSGRFDLFVGSSWAAAMSGYADITVPAGTLEGLPIGVTFIGRAWDEPTLIGLAYDFEQATKARRPPQYIPTIGDALFPGLPSALTVGRMEGTKASAAEHLRLARFR
jgi:amidase